MSRMLSSPHVEGPLSGSKPDVCVCIHSASLDIILGADGFPVCRKCHGMYFPMLSLKSQRKTSRTNKVSKDNLVGIEKNPGPDKGGKGYTKNKSNKNLVMYRPVNLYNSAIPPKELRVMRYYERIPLTTNAVPGVVNTYTFNLNSLFDPNRTGTGHQPYGYDQIVAMYAKYRVDSTSWRIMLSNGAGAATRPITSAVTVSNDSTAPASFGEMPGTRIGTSPWLGECYYQNSCRLWELTRGGKTKVQYDSDDTYAAAYNASPVELLCLHVQYASEAGSVDLVLSVELEFNATFYDPFAQNPS